MLNSLEEVLSTGDFSVLESCAQDSRTERRKQIDNSLLHPAIEAHLRSSIDEEGFLWEHQTLALEAIAADQNVVLSTSTASGKSLVFQTAVLSNLLSEGGKALVLYPLRALLSDQLARWKEIAHEVGLPSETIGEIHGQVSREARFDVLERSSVVVATPDVIQAWMMREIANSTVRRFLRDVRFIVLDEAHVYEAVFGSNTAFLLRRLLFARNQICEQTGSCKPAGIIASTATIFDAADHLECLTGWPFIEIPESRDGSPSYHRRLYHVEAPEGAGAEEIALNFVRDLVEKGEAGSFIVFHDSRQGVERLASALDHDSILPYRSGYEADDRLAIERALRDGTLKGVVSTSALELGIDIKTFSVGINVGIPPTRKAFRQRIGRVGRSGPGAFVILAPKRSFHKFGYSFCEYVDKSVEPSFLYLDNRFIQYAHCRCLIDECEALEFPTSAPPPSVNWPSTFSETFEAARPGTKRPREFDFIAQLGADNPHWNYPLRQVGEPNLVLKEGGNRDFEIIGDIALNQAIREAYPGATYLHLRRPKKVREWRLSGFERSIRLHALDRPIPTRPLLRKTVNIGFGFEDVVDGQIMTSDFGVLAEVSMQVNESVEGFRLGGKPKLYKDLRSTDPRMTRKQRDFRTTGVALKIDKPWFSGGSGAPAHLRRNLAKIIADLIVHERSVSPNDIDFTSTNIAEYTNGVPSRAVDTIVIYDSVYGGLRLTESLFSDFDYFLAKLKDAAKLSEEDAGIGLPVIEKIESWYADLRTGGSAPAKSIKVRDDELVVYNPGSLVAILKNGTLVEREIEAPLLFPVGDNNVLMYRYKHRDDGVSLVPHDQVQATGSDWSYVIWNPKTNEYRDVEMEEKLGDEF